MKSGRIIFWVFLSLLLCGCDKKKDDYSGLSNLISERNEVRQSISEAREAKKTRDKTLKEDDAQENTTTASSRKKKKISTIVLYKRNIEIVDSSSRKGLAKGVASLNKEGKIIKIKIITE